MSEFTIKTHDLSDYKIINLPKNNSFLHYCSEIVFNKEEYAFIKLVTAGFPNYIDPDISKKGQWNVRENQNSYVSVNMAPSLIQGNLIINQRFIPPNKWSNFTNHNSSNLFEGSITEPTKASRASLKNIVSQDEHYFPDKYERLPYYVLDHRSIKLKPHGFGKIHAVIIPGFEIARSFFFKTDFAAETLISGKLGKYIDLDLHKDIFLNHLKTKQPPVINYKKEFSQADFTWLAYAAFTDRGRKMAERIYNNLARENFFNRNRDTKNPLYISTGFPFTKSVRVKFIAKKVPLYNGKVGLLMHRILGYDPTEELANPIYFIKDLSPNSIKSGDRDDLPTVDLPPIARTGKKKGSINDNESHSVDGATPSKGISSDLQLLVEEENYGKKIDFIEVVSEQTHKGNNSSIEGLEAGTLSGLKDVFSKFYKIKLITGDPVIDKDYDNVGKLSDFVEEIKTLSKKLDLDTYWVKDYRRLPTRETNYHTALQHFNNSLGWSKDSKGNNRKYLLCYFKYKGRKIFIMEIEKMPNDDYKCETLMFTSLKKDFNLKKIDDIEFELSAISGYFRILSFNQHKKLKDYCFTIKRHKHSRVEESEETEENYLHRYKIKKEERVNNFIAGINTLLAKTSGLDKM